METTDLRITELEAEIVKAAEYCTGLELALIFYCEPAHYQREGESGQHAPAVIEDGGALARAALPDWQE